MRGEIIKNRPSDRRLADAALVRTHHDHHWLSTLSALRPILGKVTTPFVTRCRQYYDDVQGAVRRHHDAHGSERPSTTVFRFAAEGRWAACDFSPEICFFKPTGSPWVRSPPCPRERATRN
jgi:hypothetical protein